MNNQLAPEPILRAALCVVHVAAYTTRNWAIDDGISRKQIYDLWEAIHEIPDLIKRWRDHEESLRELRMYLKEYDRRWDSPKLEEIFDQALRDNPQLPMVLNPIISRLTIRCRQRGMAGPVPLRGSRPLVPRA